MPLYEYECTSCHKHTEKIQKFSDPEITVCPFCGGELKRVISAPAFAMKGGGWYADGYASARPGADKSGSDKSGSDKSGSDKSGSDKAASSGDGAAPASTTAAPPAPTAAPASAPASSAAEKK